MTELLARAFGEASKLSEQEQNSLAAWILDELTSEHEWEKAFTTSSDALAKLAGEALLEHHQGNTQSLDLDKL